MFETMQSEMGVVIIATFVSIFFLSALSDKLSLHGAGQGFQPLKEIYDPPGEGGRRQKKKKETVSQKKPSDIDEVLLGMEEE